MHLQRIVLNPGYFIVVKILHLDFEYFICSDGNESGNNVRDMFPFYHENKLIAEKQFKL